LTSTGNFSIIVFSNHGKTTKKKSGGLVLQAAMPWQKSEAKRKSEAESEWPDKEPSPKPVFDQRLT
jgi:hypothetical protein